MCPPQCLSHGRSTASRHLSGKLRIMTHSTSEGMNGALPTSTHVCAHPGGHRSPLLPLRLFISFKCAHLGFPPAHCFSQPIVEKRVGGDFSVCILTR